MRARDNYFDENDYDRNDDMSVSSSHCSRFSRRHDVNTFNMINYQSCENCRHLTADSQCACGMQGRFSNME